VCCRGCDKREKGMQRGMRMGVCMWSVCVSCRHSSLDDVLTVFFVVINALFSRHAAVFAEWGGERAVVAAKAGDVDQVNHSLSLSFPPSSLSIPSRPLFSSRQATKNSVRNCCSNNGKTTSTTLTFRCTATGKTSCTRAQLQAGKGQLSSCHPSQPEVLPVPLFHFLHFLLFVVVPLVCCVQPLSSSKVFFFLQDGLTSSQRQRFAIKIQMTTSSQTTVEASTAVSATTPQRNALTTSTEKQDYSTSRRQQRFQSQQWNTLATNTSNAWPLCRSRREVFSSTALGRRLSTRMRGKWKERRLSASTVRCCLLVVGC